MAILAALVMVVLRTLEAKAQISTVQGSIDEVVLPAGAEALEVRGWAADARGGAPLARVEILLDNIPSGYARLGLSRPDIARLYRRSDYRDSGWEARIPLSELGGGVHVIAALLVSRNGSPATIWPPRTAAAAVYIDPTLQTQAKTNLLIGHVDLVCLDEDGRALRLDGWAADLQRSRPAFRLEIRLNDRIVAVGDMEKVREDVERAYPGFGLRRSGWTAFVDTSNLREGDYWLSVRAVGFGARSLELGGTPRTIHVGEVSPKRSLPGDKTRSSRGTDTSR